MSFGQIKKLQQQKMPDLIPADLIKGQRFKEIVEMVNASSVLTNQDRYVYGYALLRMQQNLQALVTLWPLAAKGDLPLQQDCAVIAAHVLQDQTFLVTGEEISEKTLYTLFLVAGTLVPESQVFAILKHRLFALLWHKRDYEKLEYILKSSKKALSGILVENLSKLVFFQPAKKLTGNIAAFVGYILTGGACLLLRHSEYHNDLADALRYLANELKVLFAKLVIKKQQRYAWEQALFDKFVDYEISILARVLPLAIEHGVAVLELIPAPSYWITYDVATKPLGQKFLSWLATVSQEFCEMYNVNTQQAIIWALSGDKLSSINSILKLAPTISWHPELRLALMLRATIIKPGSLRGLVHIKDLANKVEVTSLFRNVVIQTINSILSEAKQIPITTEFWQILFEFCPVLQEPAISNIVINKAICGLRDARRDQETLNLGIIKSIAEYSPEPAFKEQIEALYGRQQACMQFLLTLNDPKKSKKIVTTIATKLALSEHLTLIADSCLLVVAQLSEEFFQHLQAVVTNKKINKLIPLEDFFDFTCDCYQHKKYLYQHSIANVVEKLNLAVTCIPEIRSDGSAALQASLPQGSILSHQDPFATLNVAVTDSKHTVMQQVMTLSKQSPEKMAQFRQAQSALFNPAQRFVHHYLRYLSYEDINLAAKFCSLSPMEQGALDSVPFRDELLNEK